MYISPYVKCVCPSCFQEVYLGECRIISGITTGKVLKNPSKGPFARMRVEPLEGPKYASELARRECTNCKYLLPHNIELVPSITLALIGDAFSGKSNYIAALIHQIRTTDYTSGFVRFTCLTPEVERTYTRNYFEPLFLNQRALASTQVAMKETADPLIYNLVTRVSPITKINLMIYDASGEDYERVDRQVQFARFVLNTNAFIFIVDPIMIAPIIEQLPLALQTPLQAQFNVIQGRRAANILASTISIFERYHGYAGGSHLPDIPIAIMLSKADLLKYLNAPYSYNFMVNPQYKQGIDLQDIDTVDREVRELLRVYQQGDLLVATRRFKRVKFFAVSAIGEPPDVNGHFTNVEPRRCLDPLLWILHELEVIR
jgi:hypothetical protein